MSVSGSPTVVISQSNTALTSIADKSEIAGFGVTVHERDRLRELGFGASQLREQALESRQWPASHAVHFVGPVIQLAIEMVSAVPEEVKACRAQIDRMDSGQLFRHAQTHVSDPLRRRLGWLHLVYVAGDPLHDEKWASKHIAGVLQPQHPRCLYRRAAQCLEDVELTLQIIGFEQGRRPGAQAQYDIPTVCTRHDREHHHLRGVPELNAVESLDPKVALW